MNARRAFPCLAMLALLAGWMAIPVAPASAGTAMAAPAAASATEIVFPPPPDEPRIRYLFSLSSVHDLKPPKRGFFRKVRDFLLGRGEEAVPTLLRPYGVAASGNRVYAADADGQSVFVFDLKALEVTRLGGTLEGRLVSPIGVAVTPGGTVFVADSMQHVVKAFGPDGKFLRQLNKIGDLKRPSGVAWDARRKRVLVADTGNGRVAIFSPEGGMTGQIGKPGTGDGEMSMPANVAVDRDGRIYVSDPIMCRAQVFTADGKYMTQFGSQGDVPGYMGRPRGIGVDSDGNIYVADAVFHAVQIFDRSGRLLLFFGAGGNVPGAFDLPAGVCVDDRDRVFVADSLNRRIQVFQYLKPKTTHEAPRP